jgi:hypothetical protein
MFLFTKTLYTSASKTKWKKINFDCPFTDFFLLPGSF